MSSIQRTRLSRLQSRWGQALMEGVAGPWWLNSLRLIAVLMGFFGASTLSVFVSTHLPNRTATALAALVVCELLVALRGALCKNGVPLHWRLLDNLRIGFVYAVVLEAFKVGS